MSADRDVITAMVAEQVGRCVTAAPNDLQAIAEGVMALFDVWREGVGPGHSRVVLTLAEAEPDASR
jgi:hypothetical protein